MISYEEQTHGWLNYIARARSLASAEANANRVAAD